MSDIFHEVEEDVRRERYEQLWKQYGKYVIALAVLIVAGVAAWQAWQRYDSGQRQQASDRLQQADQIATTGNYVQAETDLAPLTKNAPAGYSDLAKFRLAGVYLAEGKRDQSIDLLRQLTTLSDPILSSVARLRLAWTLADASPKSDIVNLLQPLMGKDSPWRFAASEVIAYVDLKDGARAQAIGEYQQIAQDNAAPATLRQRAGGIAEFLRANPQGTVAPAASGAPAETPAKPAAPAATPAPSQGKKS